MENKEIKVSQKWQKQAKNVDVIKFCHGTIFDLIFYPIMECWCDEPLWRGQLKNILKVILGHWQWGGFEKTHSQFKILEKCPCLFLHKENSNVETLFLTTHLSLKCNCQISFP